MTMSVRRVVTGHDPAGRSIVVHDGPLENIVAKRAGHQSCVAWITDRFPSSNTETEDAALLPVETTVASGSVFRIIEYAPGVAGRMHRTDSIDYIVVMSGRIWMELDEGEVVLEAGDVLVQRGTMHNWVNKGTEPCRIGVVLVSAQPVQIGDHELEAVG